MTPPPDFSSLSSAEKDALIGTLLARIDVLIGFPPPKAAFPGATG
jgi:hypothetical protein